MPIRQTLLALAAAASLGGCSCADDPDPTTASADPATRAPSGQRAERIKVAPKRIGRIRSDTAYDVLLVQSLFPRREVVEDDDGPFPKARLKVMDEGDEVLMHLFPDGDSIGMVYSTSPRLRGPQGMRVGWTLSEHAGWSKLTCRAGDAPFRKHVVCTGDKGRVLWHVTRAGVEDPTDKAALADREVVGLQWMAL